MTDEKKDIGISYPIAASFFIVAISVFIYYSLSHPDLYKFNVSYLCPNMSPGTEWYEEHCGHYELNISNETLNQIERLNKERNYTMEGLK